MFRDHYKAELDYLFQLCEELGESDPELAPILGRGADPSISRLVSGLAFSFGRLRQRLDDEHPEIIHPIIENLCPEILRPLPSGTIVELVPTAKVMSRFVVAAGVAFASRPVGGVSCTFQSVRDCEVSPLRLRSVEIASSERRSIRLVLDLLDGAELATALPRTLRLFLAHPLSAALEARVFLIENTTRVVVRSAESEATFTLEAPRAPSHWRAPAVTGARLPIASAFLGVRDYFAFPQSFAFLDLPGFDAALGLGPGVRRIEIELELARPIPKGLVFDPSTVVLHAVPAINVFRPPKLTVPLAGDKRRCAVRFGPELEDAEVYAIDRVTLVSRGLRGTPIEPWARFFPPRLAKRGASRDHAGGAGATAPDDDAAAEDDGGRYEVHRSPSVLGQSLDVSLSFSARGRSLADKVSAEIELLATNGERASAVGLGELSVPATTSPALVTFRNITPVTRAGPAATSGDYLWQLYRLLKTNLAALTDGETLATMLALANIPARQHWPEAKPDAQAFTPLLHVERQRDRSPVRDSLQSGVTVRLRLDTRRFTGPGDLRLFGEVLVPLFAATIQPHQWIELTLTDAAGAEAAAYPRTEGTRVGL